MTVAGHDPRPAANLATPRRTLLKTAAWTVPAVSVAMAAPAFAASPTDGGIEFAGTGSALLGLGLLGSAGSGGSLLGLTVLPSGPQRIVVSNPTNTALTNATLEVSIARSSGLGLLTTKGLGVLSLGASNPAEHTTGYARTSYTATERTTTSVIGLVLGRTFDTTQTFVLPTVPAQQSSSPDIYFGFTDEGVLGLDLLASFGVTATLSVGGVVHDTAQSTITIPANLSVG